MTTISAGFWNFPRFPPCKNCGLSSFFIIFFLVVLRGSRPLVVLLKSDGEIKSEVGRSAHDIAELLGTDGFVVPAFGLF